MAILGRPDFYKAGGADGRSRVGYEFGYECKGITKECVEKGKTLVCSIRSFAESVQSEAKRHSRPSQTSRNRCLHKVRSIGKLCRSSEGLLSGKSIVSRECRVCQMSCCIIIQFFSCSFCWLVRRHSMAQALCLRCRDELMAAPHSEAENCPALLEPLPSPAEQMDGIGACQTAVWCHTDRC